MKINYLIFGGSGFIGHHLTNHLTDDLDINCINFDIVESKIPNNSFEKIDVRQPIHSQYRPNSNEIIFNLAAVHRTPGHPSNEYFETNIKGAENVCNYARENNINTIVFTSSIAVYGTNENQKTEATLPMPDIPYGISKLTAEYIHILWQSEDHLNRRLVILRPGVIFGQYENGNFTRLINALSKRRFFYPGRTDTKKACMYVKDLVDVMCKMVNLEKEGVSVYNMTYKPAPKIENITKVICNNGNLKVPKIIVPPYILIFISKIAHNLFKIKSLHPDRVKKLMISNDICGEKLNVKYELNYGLENGISDWMKESKFKNKIY